MIEVARILSLIIGKSFHSLTRAADMLCLFLGDAFPFTAKNGKVIDVAEFSLHVQTQWRFRSAREKNHILLTSEDIYTPYSEHVTDEWVYDPVGRADEESSIFDVKAKELQRSMCDAVVVACNLQKNGDISIRFSNDIIFEVFVISSEDEEQWRLIDYKNDLHTVCFDEEGNISCD